MKKIRLTILSFSLISLLSMSKANATTRIISAQTSPNEAFIPAVTNAVVGDTIKWVNVNGTHTTASTSVPSGALPWSSPDLTAAGFIYVVKVVGTYNYTCHPATGGHMPGSIIVTGTASVSTVDRETNTGFFAYPNPCIDKITVETQSVNNISVYNISGQLIKSVAVKPELTKVEIDVADLAKGIYFITIEKGIKTYSQKILVH